MGTDIHAGVEYKDAPTAPWVAVIFKNKYHEKWEDEPELTARLWINRDYDLFAILADVRNGTGFAGCLTSSGFTPISSARGIPADVSSEIREQALTGDHSDTWVSLQEILDYEWTKTTTKYGVVNAVEFEDWDRKREWSPAPNSYCGDVSGRDVVKISEEKMREHIKRVVGDTRGTEWEEAIKRLDRNLYAQISWVESCAVAARTLFETILPVMLKCAREHCCGYENVRLVMNFDS